MYSKLGHLFSRAEIEFPVRASRLSIIKNKYRKGSQSTRVAGSPPWQYFGERLPGTGLGIQVEKLRSFRKLIFRNDAATKSKTHSALFVRESPRVFPFFFSLSLSLFFPDREDAIHPPTPSWPRLCRPCPSFLCSLRSRGLREQGRAPDRGRYGSSRSLVRSIFDLCQYFVTFPDTILASPTITIAPRPNRSFSSGWLWHFRYVRRVINPRTKGWVLCLRARRDGLARFDSIVQATIRDAIIIRGSCRVKFFYKIFFLQKAIMLKIIFDFNQNTHRHDSSEILVKK